MAEASSTTVDAQNPWDHGEVRVTPTTQTKLFYGIYNFLRKLNVFSRMVVCIQLKQSIQGYMEQECL